MTKTGAIVLGARGIDRRSQVFTMDPLRSREATNILVRNNSRKTRMSYERWLYEKFHSNAIRFRQRNKSYLIAKDPTNEAYDAFNSNGSIQTRIRLHGDDGFPLKVTIPVLNREVFAGGTVGYYRLVLTAVDTPAHDDYFLTFEISGATGTFTVTSVTSKIDFDTWYNVAVTYDGTNARFYVDGVEEVIAFGASRTSGVGAWLNASTVNNNSDILIGTEDFSDFGDYDLDEIRIWNDVRSTAEIQTYMDTDLPQTEIDDAALVFYSNFEEDSPDDWMVTDKKNTTAAVFLGGTKPFFSSVDDTLVFNGTTNWGRMQVVGLSAHQVFHDNRTSEIRLQILKAKQGWIAGDLELYADGVNWGFRYHYQDSGVPTTLDSGDLITQGDIGVTTYSVSIRASVADSNVKMYVDGVEQASAALTVWTPLAAGSEDGRNIAAASAVDGTEAVAMRLVFLRSNRWERNVEYYTKYFNTPSPITDLDTFAHGVLEGTRNVGAGVDLVPSTPWATTLVAALSTSENSNLPGDEYSELAVVSGASTGSIGAVPTDDINSDNAGDIIWHEQGFTMTMLVVHYDAQAFRNFYIDEDTGRTFVDDTSRLSGGFARGHKALRIVLRYHDDPNGAGTEFDVDHPPLRISGTTKVSTQHGARFLKHFTDETAGIDILVVILGTGVLTIDVPTKVITRWPINLRPNGYRPFTADTLNGQMYLTDGKTKIHIYVYKKQLRVKEWGFFSPPTLLTAATFSNIVTPWTDDVMYAYAYYNRELDQYSAMCPLDSLGDGALVATPGGREASQLDDIIPYPDWISGATDIVILATKLAGVAADPSDFHVIDYIDSRSTGHMDWRQDATIGLGTRWPIDLLGVNPLSVPDGKITIAHRGRMWVLNGKAAHFSRISSVLHVSPTSETYLFESDAQLVVEGQKDLTAGISMDGLLFLFTIESVDVINGGSTLDFEIRRIYEGRGCVSQNTLKRTGQTFTWLGQDDIYNFVGGRPESIDGEGKISQIIKEELDATRFEEAFAVVNKRQDLYELHAVGTDGQWVILYWDLKTNEFTKGQDVLSKFGAEVSEGRISTTFHGHERGFIVKETTDTTQQNYKPSSGTLSGTITAVSVASGRTVITDSAATFNTTDAGLEGNTIYLIRKNPDIAFGSIVRGTIESNTATTITFKLTDTQALYGSIFSPLVAVDTYAIGDIFWFLKTGLLYSSRTDTDRSRQTRQTAAVSNIQVLEPSRLEVFHQLLATSPESYCDFIREGQADQASTVQQVTYETDQYASQVDLLDASRYRFGQLILWVLGEFDMAGYGLDQEISSGEQIG